jgi:hypothetical protein
MNISNVGHGPNAYLDTLFRLAVCIQLLVAVYSGVRVSHLPLHKGFVWKVPAKPLCDGKSLRVHRKPDPSRNMSVPRHLVKSMPCIMAPAVLGSQQAATHPNRVVGFDGPLHMQLPDVL